MNVSGITDANFKEEYKEKEKELQKKSADRMAATRAEQDEQAASRVASERDSNLERLHN
jgi:hypothetical protein